jgi:nitrite reductase/ring-hydroxylating ferredoxin subunit
VTAPELRVRAGKLDELTPGTVWAVPLPGGPTRRPREALVLRGPDGAPRAYVNLCRHLPVPIDGGSKRYLAKGGEHLLCGTHGALFQLDDGRCVAGPCLHLALFALPCVEDDGTLYVVDTRADVPSP